MSSSASPAGPVAPHAAREAVAVLREHYGRPPRLFSHEPFELILLENLAYLASWSRRCEAFEELKRTVGVTPAAIAKAPLSALERVTAKGILKRRFALKLRECARIAIDRFDGDLERVVRGPAAEAIRALRIFPGIGLPGAEKILLFCGRQRFLAPESNGLRVLARLAIVREDNSYARTYAAARPLDRELGPGIAALQQAHLLLAQHGRTLCKLTTPRCAECPLEGRCAYARAVVAAEG